MNINEKEAYISCSNEIARNDNFGDTTLRLDCLGYDKSNDSRFLQTQNDPGVFTFDDGCRLVLGLGPTPRVSDKQEKGSSSSLLQDLPGNGDSILKLGLSGETGNLLESLEFSTSTGTDLNAHQFTSQVSVADRANAINVADEGSTSAKQSGGYMPSLLMAPTRDCRQAPAHNWDIFDLGSKSSSDHSYLGSQPSNTTSMGTMSEHSASLTSGENRPHNAKRCRFMGCTKGARGASGLCIGHGGGQRCQKPGCNKGAESRTAYCKAHGGGRRCQHLGCTKSAEGKTDHCIAHGGGRRCGYVGGCSKAARGRSGLCIRHGGGKRCKVEGCTRSAEGRVGLCISHGGGRRCQFANCGKGAQGSTMFCKAHGGGKRCIFAGCTKGAEGSTPLCKGHGGGKRCMFDGGGICPKSVHGGTNFCVAHGGGKRCAIPGCTKSARGRTDCCVKHGGGKRCKVENCGKSAQGSTDFCKAHGGGKRCSWGDGKCEKFARGRSGLCAAHTNMIQQRENRRGMSVISDCGDSMGRPAKRQHLIPPEVLVPLSMKSASSYSVQTTVGEQNDDRSNVDSRRNSFEFLVPEGRVHGGGLMSLLGGNLVNNSVVHRL
ncbi:putative WRKY transcription factor 19 [Bienertia sinuspersici]